MRNEVKIRPLLGQGNPIFNIVVCCWIQQRHTNYINRHTAAAFVKLLLLIISGIIKANLFGSDLVWHLQACKQVVAVIPPLSRHTRTHTHTHPSTQFHLVGYGISRCICFFVFSFVFISLYSLLMIERRKKNRHELKESHNEVDMMLVSTRGKRVALSVWVVSAEIANK